ncbi:dTMP kinase [Desulfallas sp. Bu1-1]|uniref:dTMP kinase n=1 Tax=Desulfallas sp. Bu1-1 TaxID=2787620 RepID=UPI00189DB656|nr:dTMP kinase [Desulfallas sp. Bu1-1]MBF7084162.1 dTMP kinase [Desulfallas sp. Bu1-1]
MTRGKFIVFEGIDGSGKTTQMELLARVLEARGMPVLRTREPGGTRVGDRLRGLLLDPDYRDLTPRTEAFLYAADRAQHVTEKILPALHRGETVLCDRFLYSTLAYQGWGRGVDIVFLTRLNQLATGGLAPDRVILLDLEVEDGLRRALKNRPPDRLEGEKAAFFRRVRQGYLEQASRWPEIFRVVRADAPEQEVHRRVLTALGME